MKPITAKKAAKMQKKLGKFLQTEDERLENMKYTEGITFEQLKKISLGK